jgi:hypothetical protein
LLVALAAADHAEALSATVALVARAHPVKVTLAALDILAVVMGPVAAAVAQVPLAQMLLHHRLVLAVLDPHLQLLGHL